MLSGFGFPLSGMGDLISVEYGDDGTLIDTDFREVVRRESVRESDLRWPARNESFLSMVEKNDGDLMSEATDGVCASRIYGLGWQAADMTRESAPATTMSPLSFIRDIMTGIMARTRDIIVSANKAWTE